MMRHKKFDEVFPYTYVIRNIKTGISYYGVRAANVSLGLSPANDLGIKYFSSGKLASDFRNHPQNYMCEVRYTFDEIEEAIEWEFKVITKLMHDPKWANITNTYCKIITEKHRKETSQRMSENNPSKNGLSEEHKKKIGVASSLVMSGKPKSLSHRAAMSTSRLGSTPWNKGKKTGPLTEEHRIKLGQSRLGKKRGKYKPYSKPRKQRDLTLLSRGCCFHCQRELDIGNLVKHIRGQFCQKNQ